MEFTLSALQFLVNLLIFLLGLGNLAVIIMYIMMFADRARDPAEFFRSSAASAIFLKTLVIFSPVFLRA